MSVCLKYGGPGFDPWVGKIRWSRKWQPTSAFLSGKFHGQRSLVSYSPWGCKESGTTEHASIPHYNRANDLSVSFFILLSNALGAEELMLLNCGVGEDS